MRVGEGQLQEGTRQPTGRWLSRFNLVPSPPSFRWFNVTFLFQAQTGSRPYDDSYWRGVPLTTNLQTEISVINVNCLDKRISSLLLELLGLLFLKKKKKIILFWDGLFCYPSTVVFSQPYIPFLVIRMPSALLVQGWHLSHGGLVSCLRGERQIQRDLFVLPGPQVPLI